MVILRFEARPLLRKLLPQIKQAASFLCTNQNYFYPMDTQHSELDFLCVDYICLKNQKGTSVVRVFHGREQHANIWY